MARKTANTQKNLHNIKQHNPQKKTPPTTTNQTNTSTKQLNENHPTTHQPTLNTKCQTKINAHPKRRKTKQP